MMLLSPKNCIGNLRSSPRSNVVARLRRAIVWGGVLAVAAGMFAACRKPYSAKMAVARLQVETFIALREAFPPPMDQNMSTEERKRKLSRAYEGLSAIDPSNCPEEVQLEFKKYVSAMHRSADFWSEMPGRDEFLKDPQNREKAKALGAEVQQEFERMQVLADKYAKMP